MSKALIYVVDDDPIYGATIKKILSVQKFENVELYKSGEECLEALHKKPSLIILDFSLETLNGLDVLRMVKDKMPKAKVVFLTSLNEDPVLQEKCKEEGALGFFQKDQQGIADLVEWMKKHVSSGFLSFFK